ncbi:MAG: anaerobic ribonucleoside-triphosphate reductase [Thaumarchaeota archaeon]|nr:anaerobic ribonucleoside-triphosphate reductase [Candidatus Geocrenenecus arthurdayi]
MPIYFYPLVLPIIVIFVFLAVNYPRSRLILGIISIIIGTLLFADPISSIPSFITGLFLMVWGTVTRKKERVARLRICPHCGRDLSRIPGDIKKCPYCGNDLG